MAAAANGGRVTIRELYEALMRQRDRTDDMERRILARLDAYQVEMRTMVAREVECLQAGIDAKGAEIKACQADVVELKIASARGDKVIAAITAVLGAVAAWLGLSR